MATPTANSVPTTDYDTFVFGDDTDTLLYGTKWGSGGLGTGVTLTYSFPQGTAWWQSPYSDEAEPDNYSGLSGDQMTAARAALASWAAVANVQFTEVGDDASVVGEIRFAFTDLLNPNAAAHAYMPEDDPVAGDIWFSSDDTADTALPGSYFYSTIIHELGHSLGLNHSFDLSPEYDNNFHTIMSYTASPWSDDGDNYASFYPTTPMYLDIVALQAIYGAPLANNPGDTTYTFIDTYYFETIFDTGGNDTIVYAGSDTCEIYLTEGSFSVLSKEIDFSTESSRSTVAIGPDTIIENATGGNKSDRIEGNSAKNILRGNGGRDTLYGGAGGDTLVGGSGYDKLKGGGGNDRFDFNKISEIGKSSHDVIMDFKPGHDRIDLASIDANSLTSGNGAFKFKASGDSTLNGKAGELCWYNESGKTFVMGDTDGNKVADFVLELTGTKALTAGDFVL